MAHTCKALILHCIDFRLGKAIKNYMEENGLLGDCDIIAVAGAAKNIASPTDDDVDREFVMNQIAISKRLHGITEIILMNHTDCGAYGGRSAFSSDEEEMMRHREELTHAKEIIAGFYPDIAVKTLIANIDDSGAVRIGEIA